jgi:hypothetical protein
MQGRLLHAYPPNAKGPRSKRMVSPTLSKTLTTIQNRQRLTDEGCSSGCHFRFEHHFVCYLFQVAYDLRLTSGACVFQSSDQPHQSCSLAIYFWRYVLYQQSFPWPTAIQATAATIPDRGMPRLHNSRQLWVSARRYVPQNTYRRLVVRLVTV